MNLQQILSMISTGNLTPLLKQLEKESEIENTLDLFEQLNPKLHKVVIDKDKTRPDKTIYAPNPDTGKAEVQKMVPVARIPLSLQKKIVLTASAFLGCPEATATTANAQEENLFTVLDFVEDQNKITYRFKEILKHTMSERHCAELWFPQDAPDDYYFGIPFKTKKKLSVMLLANSLGDEMFPVLDQYRDLIAFGRKYKVFELDETTEQWIEIPHFDIYTNDQVFYSKLINDAWQFSVDGGQTYSDQVRGMKNPFGKIPIIYYCQPYSEWHDVEILIERLELKISNHADTNDYFDSPIIVATGNIQSFAEKGETGKLIELEQGADLKYLTWTQAPESAKMEIANLEKYIYSLTHTPDISFEQMKGLGAFSGIAISMFFFDAHLKAANHEDNFGVSVQRRYNLLKAMISFLDPTLKAGTTLRIKPVFEYYLPRNVVELMQLITQAKSAGIMSQETAIEQNPLLEDTDQEKIRIKSDEDKAQAQKKEDAAAGGFGSGTP